MERYSINRQKDLTEEQKQIIVGTLLGDGFIQKRGNSYRLKLKHSQGQLRYMLWKLDRLQPFFDLEPHIETSICRGKHQKSCYAYSLAQKDLVTFHSLFYDITGRKIITPDLIDYLTPLSIAVWYMDDGSIESNGRIRIYSNSFSKEENEVLSRLLQEKFDISLIPHSKFEKKYNRYYWYLLGKKDSSKKFIDLVYSHIVPSMQYKVSNTRNDYTPENAVAFKI